MKKLFALILSMVALSAPAMADVDLSSMSYDELVALKDQINLAIWNSQEWQEVTVPQGIWEIGVDIPVGHWTIRAADGVWCSVQYGSQIDTNGKELSRRSNDFFSEILVSTSSRVYTPGKDATALDVNALVGAYICIDKGDAVFTPYAGKPSLGFK